MNIDFQELMNNAKEAAKNSYSPFSRFAVGAAVITPSGKIYRGCNVENSSFGLTNCAERTAFFKAVYDGQRKFSAIAICGGENGNIKGICPPCGPCRQVMREFCKDDFLIYMIDVDNKFEVHTLDEILPYSFSL